MNIQIGTNVWLCICSNFMELSPLGNQSVGTLTWHPSHQHYQKTSLSNADHQTDMSHSSEKDKLCKPLALFGKDYRVEVSVQLMWLYSLVNLFKKMNNIFFALLKTKLSTAEWTSQICLLLYILETSKVTLGQVPTCVSDNFIVLPYWETRPWVPLIDTPTQAHNLDTVLTSPLFYSINSEHQVM